MSMGQENQDIQLVHHHRRRHGPDIYLEFNFGPPPRSYRHAPQYFNPHDRFFH